MPHATLARSAAQPPRAAEQPALVVPEISVCIANWNCRDLLRACLASLRDQADTVRLEIIVVDNASTDGAADLVARTFSEVILVRNAANRGFAAASNQGAALARAPYLFFLNNDTVVPAGMLRRLLDEAQRHPEAGLLGPRLLAPDGRTQVSCRPRPTVATLLHRTALLRWTGLLRGAYRRYRREAIAGPATARQVETLMGAALLVPRRAFQQWGPWDEDYTFGGEDFDLSTRIGRHAPLVYLPDVTVVHHGRSSTRANVGYSAPNVAIGFARYLRKSGSSAAALLAYKLVLTLDAPVQLLAKGLQSLWRRGKGQRSAACKSWQRVREQWYFLTRGLGAFWRV